MFVIMPVAGVALSGKSYCQSYNFDLMHLLLQGYAGTVPRVQNRKLISYAHLVPKLQICGTIPSLSHLHR
jgi:hypothetical protein